MKMGSCDHTAEARLTRELAIERAKNEELQLQLDNTQGATRGASTTPPRRKQIPAYAQHYLELLNGPSVETIEAQQRLENQQRLKSASQPYDPFWWQKEHGFMGRCN